MEIILEAVHEDREPMNQTPKRYSVGRHVLVGMGRRPAIVKSCESKPSQMGEYAHVVEFEDDQQQLRVLGCDIQPVPALDEDLAGGRAVIHIQNSNVANLNLGSQIGTINAALQHISGGDESQKEFARTLDEFTQAVLDANLAENNKEEIVGALSTIAEQAAKKPEERSKGTLRAVVAWIPPAVATAAHLTALWEKFGPIIKSYFNL